MIRSSTIKALSKGEAQYRIKEKYFKETQLRIFTIKQISKNQYEVAFSYNDKLHSK